MSLLQTTTFAGGPVTLNGQPSLYEQMTLPATGTGLSGAIKFFKPNLSNNNRYIAVWMKASAVSGTNLDIAWMGGFDEAGTTAVLITDAIVADITDTTAAAAVIDLNANPYPFYFIRVTVDADESANVLEIRAYGPNA